MRLLMQKLTTGQNVEKNVFGVLGHIWHIYIGIPSYQNFRAVAEEGQNPCESQKSGKDASEQYILRLRRFQVS